MPMLIHFSRESRYGSNGIISAKLSTMKPVLPSTMIFGVIVKKENKQKGSFVPNCHTIL
jgi:hypothetical protein